ncbi:MAG TPA: hypothetical protein PK295_00550 [Candidatus Magasanikbacteria bacterium]|nr:hypothetical protein [Candidatus Magasanikbacteria bacterium]
MNIQNSPNNENEPKKLLKRYRVVAESLTVEGEKTEGDVWAENEESAKSIMLKSLIEKESGGVLLDSPLQMITAEEINLQPRTVTDIIDNIRYYIEAMRENEDIETLPNLLSQYAEDYFKEVNFNRKNARNLAIFGIDRAYRTITTLDPVDKYTRSFVAKVLSTLWKTIQNQNTNVFYIVDNTFDNDEKFNTMVEMFELMGFAVVTPYHKQECVVYEEVETQINGYMESSRMIMYVEKDDSVNYLDKIKELAKESDYLCMFRYKAVTNSQMELIESRYQF